MKTREDIMRQVEEEDVEFIRLQFSDIFGNLKNIAVTINQLDRVLTNRFYFEGSALFDDLFPYEEELYLYPDLNSFVILPWRPQQHKVGKLVCDVCYSDGRLFEMSPRTILKRIVASSLAEGYTFIVNPECEFFLFHTDEEGRPTTVSHEKAGYLDVGPMDFGENARREMVLTLEDMGFDIESSHHEMACAQHEIDFAQGESLETADALMTFKLAVRSIAKRFGLCATFMPKPRMNCAGSGMHLNFTLYKNGKNLFESAPGGEIPATARYFIGGIMEHAEGMCAITNPIVNSYKRLLSGYQAPYTIDWSCKGETSLVKYLKRPEEEKVEVRFPDPSANPYLAIAVCIAAGLDGIRNKTDPDKVNPKKNKHLPGNLKGAVKLMQKDELICKTLGKEFVKIYSSIKTSEWESYMRQVSDWELEQYLNKI